MTTMLRALAAALPFAMPIAAQAQTAVETVAFITLGIEASRAGTSSMGDVSTFELEGDRTINWKLTWGSGRVTQDLMIYEENDCQFRIIGTAFTTVPYERNYELDVTLDFTNISPSQSRRQFNYPGQSHYWNYYQVDGVEVCSNGEVGGGVGERMPEAGTCRQNLQTFTWMGGDRQTRLDAALAHLRNNYCKARAF